MIGGRILESYDARATYYAAMGLMDSENSTGPLFGPEDLHALADRGHEVAMHGFGHLSARATPVNQFLDDIRHCESALQEHLAERASRNYAYPYGHATLKTKRQLGPNLRSSRGTIGGVNGPKVDLNLLLANNLYGDASALDRAEQLIRENVARPGWLIFYTHDVSDNPSPFGCTPSLLERVVAFAVKSGAKILTIEDVLRQLSPVD